MLRKMTTALLLMGLIGALAGSALAETPVRGFGYGGAFGMADMLTLKTAKAEAA